MVIMVIFHDVNLPEGIILSPTFPHSLQAPNAGPELAGHGPRGRAGPGPCPLGALGEASDFAT